MTSGYSRPNSASTLAIASRSTAALRSLAKSVRGSFSKGGSIMKSFHGLGVREAVFKVINAARGESTPAQSSRRGGRLIISIREAGFVIIQYAWPHGHVR